MIITLDGPAGSGKSSTAREVARRLGYRYLDSGAFYRALTWAALDAGIDPHTWENLTPMQLDALNVAGISAGNAYRLFAGHRDISELIRSPDVNANVSRIAALPAVRDWLLGRLRAAAVDGDLVTDGRDMGTVVFPDAGLKIFLVADPAVRASRRLVEQGHDPHDDNIRQEVERLSSRDRADSERATAPLIKATDAVEIDTTDLTLEEQIQQIVSLARERGAPPEP
jgi:cytidylate kinase